eukprot:symbB.v1.2.037532.t1/scaffold5569.1/size25780/3
MTRRGPKGLTSKQNWLEAFRVYRSNHVTLLDLRNSEIPVLAGAWTARDFSPGKVCSVSRVAPYVAVHFVARSAATAQTRPMCQTRPSAVRV